MHIEPAYADLVRKHPEVNGVANTLGRLHAGLQQLGHRVQVVRPRQPGDDGRRSDAELVLTRGWPLPGYPGLQWGMSSLHKLLRCWKRQRPDVLYIATEGPRCPPGRDRRIAGPG
ncbi:glycosyltransferase, partial [Pseudomonas aeruginosa]|uniref:glycosyltransferase n=1 Tax=Pseudomonas aeruginosa TaxID=287 RepID=UPI003968BB6A